jgi:hypothetical protein
MTSGADEHTSTLQRLQAAQVAEVAPQV